MRHHFTRVKHFVRRHRAHTLRLESCPLHTERPDWAAKAPAQVDAACKRGADVIAFTEVHGHLNDSLAAVAARNGYGFHSANNSAVAFKMTLDATASTDGHLAKVAFKFHGHEVTVFGGHWPTHRKSHLAAREAYTAEVIAALDKAAKGTGLAFFLADSNPAGPLSDPHSEPRATLNKAGVVLVYEELNDFPAGIGVTTIGRVKADTRVTAKSVATFPALGSDHIPALATYRVR